MSNTKGLRYVGDEGTHSRYTYFIESRRAFDVLVDNATPATELPEGTEVPAGYAMHVITIAMVGAPVETAQGTKGFAVRAPFVDENGMSYRIDSNSIRSYVHGREALLLARLFVPSA